jgi:hypothetical protein
LKVQFRLAFAFLAVGIAIAMTAQIQIEAFGKSVTLCFSLDTLGLQMTFFDSVASMLNVVESRFDLDATVKPQDKQYISERIQRKRKQINELKLEAHQQHRAHVVTKSLRGTVLPALEEDKDNVQPVEQIDQSRNSLDSSGQMAHLASVAETAVSVVGAQQADKSRGWKLPKWLQRQKQVVPTSDAGFDGITSIQEQRDSMASVDLGHGVLSDKP